jgi:hypothetical protein
VAFGRASVGVSSGEAGVANPAPSMDFLKGIGRVSAIARGSKSSSSMTPHLLRHYYASLNQRERQVMSLVAGRFEQADRPRITG